MTPIERAPAPKVGHIVLAVGHPGERPSATLGVISTMGGAARTRRGGMLDVARLVSETPAEAHLYCCGPMAMLDAFKTATSSRPASSVHLEYFTADVPSPAVEGGFVVELARSKLQISIPPGKTILEALRAHGVVVPSSCEQGICGSCETRVLAGTPDHRDLLLSDGEKAANEFMMICCSGSKSAVLVLDL